MLLLLLLLLLMVPAAYAKVEEFSDKRFAARISAVTSICRGSIFIDVEEDEDEDESGGCIVDRRNRGL